MPIQKNYYHTDNKFRQYLEDVGFDVNELLKMYRMTPASTESVYKDFYKYLMPVPWEYKPTNFKAIAFEMLCEWKNKPKVRARLFNYDEACSYIDRSKSATVFFNRVYKNKGEVLDSPDFEKHFLFYLHALINQENILTVWMATQKEEIRDSNKIDELSIRSFVIIGIFALIVNHMCNLDGDLISAEHWRTLKIGLGMSLFERNYDDIFSLIARFKHKFFYDVGKWDSRFQHEVKAWELEAHSTMYKVRTVTIREFLGDRMYAKWCALGFNPNQMVDTYVIRHRLLKDETLGPVMLPEGELFIKERGKNSGDGRTTAQNCGGHKFYEFETAAKLYGTRAREYSNFTEDWKMGDDQCGSSDDKEYFPAQMETLRSYGYEVEGRECTFDELEFLSTSPKRIILNDGTKLWVPCVNSAKIVASLADKKHIEDSEIDFSRLTSARILCFFTEDYSKLEKVNTLFLQDYPQFTRHAMNKSYQEILNMFVGRFEQAEGVSRGFSFSSGLSPVYEQMETMLGRPLNYLSQVKIFKQDLKINNYCGPYWSAGEFQSSVDSDVPAQNKLDRCCKSHDASYARDKSDSFFSNSLASIDYTFYRCALQVAKEEGISFQSLAALLFGSTVNIQAMVRRFFGRRGRGGGWRRGGRRPAPYRGRNNGGRIGLAQAIRQAASNASKRQMKSQNPVSSNQQSQLRPATTRIKQGGKRGKRGRRGGASLSSNNLQIGGTDYLGTVAVTTTQAVGDIIGQWSITPQLLANSRVAKMAQLFDQYDLKFFEIIYETQQPTTQPGQLIFFHEPDPDEDNFSSENLITKALSSPKSRCFSVYEGRRGDSVKIRVTKTPRDPVRYVSDLGEDRLTTYGTIYLINNYSGYSANMTLGTLKIRYCFVFRSPLLEDQSVNDYQYGHYSMTTPSASDPLGTGPPVRQQGSNVGFTRESGTGFSLDKGTYIIQFYVLGTTLSTITFTATSPNSRTLVFQQANSGSTSFVYQATVICNNPDIGFSFTQSAATITSLDVRIWRVNGGMTVTSRNKNKTKVKFAEVEEEIQILRQQVQQLMQEVPTPDNNNSIIRRRVMSPNFN